ncbi:ankyrin repeat domain-containing protein [Bacillus niameyensis]|uniref:ankyrin repeat domain-containing protein n=1 Tax=Bacillus niameyensis TaxID=1522308 RepID=UPI0008411612|nr:ankyrin repeat domain-containing protein [Bacillus niameyensis]
MLKIYKEEPITKTVVKAIQFGEIEKLKDLLKKVQGLAQARVIDGEMARTLLHIATDWPGHYPNCQETITLLVQAGADINAPFIGPHSETPLHWAASNDDVEALVTLVQLGADMEARGGVIGNGTPLTDARIFGQWQAAHKLVELGAKTTFYDEAALALMNRMESRFSSDIPPAHEEIDCAFWNACHGGQLHSAKYLFSQGANVNWLPSWDKLTPLDAALRNANAELVKWLEKRGAKSQRDL